MDIAGREDVFILDCPVSGTKLAEGALRIFASGTPEALERSNALLEDMSEQVYHVPGGAGSASKVNMVNQLLIGIHIAVSGEAIALATKANLDIREVYDIISTGAAGDSRIFENRVPRMIKGDWTPHSTIDDFVQIMVCFHGVFRDPLSKLHELTWNYTGDGHVNCSLVAVSIAHIICGRAAVCPSVLSRIRKRG